MFIWEKQENILWVHYDLKCFRWLCVGLRGRCKCAISRLAHLTYAEPFWFYANAVLVGRNEKEVMQDNYRGTLETGGALTAVI